MTRKDFNAIAAAFKRQMEVAPREAHYSMRTVAEELARICKADNPAFDRDRFMTACGF